MSYSRQKTISAKLGFAKTALQNAKNLSLELEAFGYGADRIVEGEALYDNARKLQAQKKRIYGNQFKATDLLLKSKKKARAEYVKQLKLARIALRGNRSASEKLGFQGLRKVAMDGWLGQAKLFYQNLLSDSALLGPMTDLGIGGLKIQEGMSLLGAVEQALAKQKQAKGKALDATEKRDLALHTLDIWMYDFTAVARIALQAQPQKLESLGLVTSKLRGG